MASEPGALPPAAAPAPDTREPAGPDPVLANGPTARPVMPAAEVQAIEAFERFVLLMGLDW